MIKKLLNSKLFYVIIIAFCVVLVAPMLFGLNKASKSVSAASTIINETDMDANLYYKLKPYGGGYLTETALKDVTELNLNFSSMYITSTTNKIADLAGLELLELTNVKKLTIANQNLTEITASNLAGLINLEYLDISNNALTSIDLSPLTKLKTLILYNNNLTEIDATLMNNEGFTEPVAPSVIDLSHNHLNSIEDVKLPPSTATTNMQVKLVNNNITDLNSLTADSYDYVLGIQGLRGLNYYSDIVEVATSYPIKYYNWGSEYKVIISKKNSDNTFAAVKTFCDSVSSPIQTTTLPIGEYKVEYFINDVLITADNNGNRTGDYNCIYIVSKSFNVVPTPPTYYFLVKGKQYLTIDKLTSKATIVVQADKGAKVFYKMSNDDKWIEGSEIPLTMGGTYVVQIKSQLDGSESQVVTANIIASSNLYISDILLVVLIVAVGAVILFGVYPLVKKYVIDR